MLYETAEAALKAATYISPQNRIPTSLDNKRLGTAQ